MRALAVPAAFVAVSLVASSALAADPKSFTAALDSLPTDFAVVATLSGKALRALPSYTTSVTQLLSADKDVKTAHGDVKTLCKIDLTTAVDDVTVGIDDKKSVAVFLSANGVDEKKVTACVQAMVKKHKSKTVTAKEMTAGGGKIVEYSVAGDPSKLYLGFVGDVIVITDQPTKKADLERAMGGKGALAKSKGVTTWQSKISTSALAFAIGVKEIVDPKATIKGFAASGDVATGGDIKVKATVELKDAKMASNLSGEVTKELAKAPKEISKSAKSFKVTTQAGTVAVEGTIYEADYKNLKP